MVPVEPEGVGSVTSKTDSFKKHLDDTLANGHGIINENVAREIIKEGPSCIEWLINIGVPFTKNSKDEISLTLEAAHSERRIVHIDDKTGSVVHKQLYEKVLAKKNIQVFSIHQ